MQDEIETILDVDIEHIHGTKYEVGGYTIDAYGESQDKLLDACRSLQQSLPDDLEARREAAADFLGRDFQGVETKHNILAIFENHILTGSGAFTNPQFCAVKRLLGIHDGDFSAESEYYPPEPEYPEQWTQPVEEGGGGLSEESAEWLYNHLKEYGFHYADRVSSAGVPPPILRENGFVSMCLQNDGKGGFDCSDCPLKAPFLTGGLELPEFIDEVEL